MAELLTNLSKSKRKKQERAGKER